jgi:hypothetical protein
MGIPKIQEPILERIRCLEFPQFFFLSRAAAMEKDSLLRLDSTPSVGISNRPNGNYLRKPGISFAVNSNTFCLGRLERSTK